MQTPTIGRTVIVRNFQSNGSNDQPAVITRVWSYAPEQAKARINVTVLPDNGAPTSLTSIELFGDEISANQHLKTQGSYGLTERVAYFPTKE